MLMNNLDPDVAEDPANLVVYGGTGRAARSWEAFHAIVATLRAARERRDAARAERQAGRRLPHARDGAARADREQPPRARLGRLGDVPAARGRGADDVRPDDGRVVDLHRHAGHPAGHVRDVRGGRAQALRRLAARAPRADRRLRRHGRRAAARRHDARRRLPDRRRRRRSISSGASSTRYLDLVAPGPRRRPARGRGGARRGRRALDRHRRLRGARSSARCSSAASCPTSSPTRRARTTRSAATCPTGSRWRTRPSCARATRSATSSARARRWPRHCAAMVEFQERGSEVFDYGNSLRAEARTGGFDEAFAYPGLRRGLRPAALLHGHRPVPLGGALGRPGDIAADRRAPWASSSPRTRSCSAGSSWRARASPTRACRRASAGSATASAHRAGLRFNDLVRSGEVKAPIVIGRDHLDSGSVASPYRETEGMMDGSDAIADWPILNALLGVSSGAAWVAVHHGGGVGIGRSIHSGVQVVADGTDEGALRVERVLTNDPGTGVMRHADAGYELARETRARARSRPADAAVSRTLLVPELVLEPGGAVRARSRRRARRRAHRRACSTPPAPESAPTSSGCRGRAARPGPRQRAFARLPAPPARPRRGASTRLRPRTTSGRGARRCTPPPRRSIRVECALWREECFDAGRRAGYTAVGEFHYVHHRPDGTPYDEPNELALAVVEAARAVGVRIVLLMAAYARGGAGRGPTPGSAALLRPQRRGLPRAGSSASPPPSPATRW